MKFIAFTTHVLDQDTKVKLTTTRNDKCIRTIRFIYTKRYICFKLFHQTLTNFTGSNPFTFTTCEWTIVYEECHLQCWLINFQNRQSFRIVRISDRFTDVDIFNPCNRNDVTCSSFFGLNTFQTLETKQFLDTSSFAFAITHNNSNGLALTNYATVHTTDCDTSEVFIVVHQGNEELKWLFHVLCWMRNVTYNCIVDCHHVVILFSRIIFHAGSTV